MLIDDDNSVFRDDSATVVVNFDRDNVIELEVDLTVNPIAVEVFHEGTLLWGGTEKDVIAGDVSLRHRVIVQAAVTAARLYRPTTSPA